MKRLAAILRDCEARGVRLRTNGGELEVRGASTPKLRDELKARKPNIVHYLKTGGCHHELAPDVCKVCNGYVRRLIESAEGEDR